MNIEELRHLRKLLNQQYYVINTSNPNEPINEEQERINVIEMECTRESTISFAQIGIDLLEKALRQVPTIESMQLQIKLALIADEQLSPFCINNMHFVNDIVLATFHVFVPSPDDSTEATLLTTEKYVPVKYQVFIEELNRQGYDFGLPNTLSEYTTRFIDTCRTAPMVDNKLANAMRRARGEKTIDDFGFDFTKLDLSIFSPTININLIDEKVM